MKVFFNKIKDKLKALLKNLWFFSRIGRNPDTDWKFILMSCTLLFVILSFYSFYIYFKIDSIDEIESKINVSEIDTISLDSKSIEQVFNYFRQKELLLEDLKNTPMSIRDPSI